MAYETQKTFIAILIAVSLFSTINPAQAQTRNVAVVVGKNNDIVFAPSEATNTINFAFFSTSVNTSTVHIDLAAPNKTVVSAKSLGFAKAITLEAAVGQIKNGNTQELVAAGGNFTSQVIVGTGGTNGSTGGSAGSSNQYICNGYALASFKTYYLQIFMQSMGRQPVSETELCDVVFGDLWHSGGDSTGGGDTNSGQASGSASLTAHSLKDACNKPNRVVEVFALDLRKIAASERAAGFTISVNLTESAFGGNTPATLKPKSDGKYAPRPLLLTALINGNDRHYYMRFANGSVKKQLSMTKKSIVKITPYNGYIFGASLPDSELRGGKMTVITADTQAAYGLCFKATRTRQYLNGYPQS